MKRLLFVVISMLAGGPASADSLPINSEAVVLKSTIGCDIPTLRAIIDRDFASETILRGFVNRSIEINTCRRIQTATPVSISAHDFMDTQKAGKLPITLIRFIGDRQPVWVLSGELAPQ